VGSHTPGPWRLRKDKKEAPDDFIVMAPAGDSIADCSPGNPYMPLDQALANARLIAAAPELLDAYKEAIRVLIKKGCGHLNTNHFRTTCECCAAIRQLQAAVYSAQGESSGIPKISPSAGPCTGLVAESSDGPANSSEGNVEQKPTPGDKRIGGSTAQTFRRLKDSGDSFEEKLKDL